MGKGGRQRGSDLKLDRLENNTRGTIADRVMQGATTLHEADRVLREYADLENADEDYDEINQLREELNILSFESDTTSRANDAARHKRIKEISDRLSKLTEQFTVRKTIKIHRDLVKHVISYLGLPYNVTWEERRGDKLRYQSGPLKGKIKPNSHYDITGPAAHWLMFLIPVGHRNVLIEYDGALLIQKSQDGLVWSNVSTLPQMSFFDWRQYNPDERPRIAYQNALERLHTMNIRSVQMSPFLRPDQKVSAIEKIKKKPVTMAKLEKFLLKKPYST